MCTQLRMSRESGSLPCTRFTHSHSRGVLKSPSLENLLNLVHVLQYMYCTYGLRKNKISLNLYYRHVNRPTWTEISRWFQNSLKNPIQCCKTINFQIIGIHPSDKVAPPQAPPIYTKTVGNVLNVTMHHLRMYTCSDLTCKNKRTSPRYNEASDIE